MESDLVSMRKKITYQPSLASLLTRVEDVVRFLTDKYGKVNKKIVSKFLVRSER